jgi:arsenate reductase (glutaredoxin)
LLADHGFEATYREYTKQPLSRAELVDLLSATASDDEVLDAMVANNRLLQRPILVTPKGARVGRPVENLLEVM